MTPNIRPTQSQFGQPLLAPDLQRKQFELQRNQLMAQQLMQGEMPQGQMVGNQYVAPHFTQQLAAALRPVMGQALMNRIPEQMADLQRAQQDHVLGQFGFKPNPQQLAAGLSGDPAQALPAGGAGHAPASQSLIPNIPGLSREQQAYLAMNIGMDNYLKLAANKAGPINVAPGGSLYNPQTGQVDYTAPKDGIAIENGRGVAIPGYSEAAAAAAGDLTRAQEAAKAGYDLVAVPNGEGGTQMMPRSDAVEVLGGAAPSSNRSGSSDMSPGLGVTPNPVSQSAATALNDDWVSGSYRPALDAASAASSLKNTITAMRNIPLETGFGTEFKGAAANLLTSLGVPNAAALATDVQTFQSLAMDRLQTELMKQKGPQTEGDAERAAQTFAKLSNTPEANRFIFDFAEAKANMDMRKAAFYEAALPLARKSGDLTEVDRRWRKLQGSIWDDPLLIPYKEMQ